MCFDTPTKLRLVKRISSASLEPLANLMMPVASNIEKGLDANATAAEYRHEGAEHEFGAAALPNAALS